MLTTIVAAVLALGAGDVHLQEGTLVWRPLYEPGCGGWIVSVGESPHENAASTSASGVFPLAIALPSVTDAANFKTWKVVINGIEKRGSLAWNGSALTYQGLGLTVLVK